MRDEQLNCQQFHSLVEAKVLTEDWGFDYDMNRPHSAQAWLTPVEFVKPGSTDKHTSWHSEWTGKRGPISSSTTYGEALLALRISMGFDRREELPIGLSCVEK